MAEPYALRFFKKLLVEMGAFLSETLTALCLAIAAFVYQFIAKKITWTALKENTASVMYPFVWVVCAFGCYYIVKAAIHLHMEMVEDANRYKSAIPEYKPKGPSPGPAILMVAISIGLLALLSYEMFRAAFPGNKATAYFDPDLSGTSSHQNQVCAVCPA